MLTSNTRVFRRDSSNVESLMYFQYYVADISQCENLQALASNFETGLSFVKKSTNIIKIPSSEKK